MNPVLKAIIDATGARRGSQEFARSVNDMGNSAKRNSGKLALLSSAVTMVGTAFIAATGYVVTKSNTLFKNFDTEIRKVNSVVGGTAKTMKELSVIAREVGASTNFTASQAAQGLYNLASAGLKVEEQGKAIKDTLYFAGATAIELSQATDIVSSAMRQFNIEAENTSRITNVMAAAISSSRASADRLQASLMYVGPIAGTMNVSLEETISILAKLYDAGMEGSQAGTTLRSAMLRLTAPTGEMKKVLADLGITMADIDIKTNGLINVFSKLNEAHITEAQAAELFGQEGINIIRVIRQQKSELENYRNEITNTNKALQMYKDQTAGAQGDTDRLGSSVQELGLKIGTTLQPSVSAITKGLKSLTDTMNDWYYAVTDGIASMVFTAAEGYAHMLSLAKGMASTYINGANIIVKTIGQIGVLAFNAIIEVVSNILKWISDKVFDITDYVSGLVKKIKLPENVPFANKINGVIKSLGDSFGGASEKTREFVDSMTDTTKVQDKLKSWMRDNGASIENDINKIKMAWWKVGNEIKKNQDYTNKLIEHTAQKGVEEQYGKIESPETAKERMQKIYEDKKKESEKKITNNEEEEAKTRKNIMNDFLSSVGVQLEEQKNLYKNWASGFTESLADSLMEGKSMFDDFFKSVMKQLLQLQIQKSITNPLFEGLGLLPGKAIGGPVTAGSPYIVGEKGPELFMPNSSGTIIPNNKLSGSSAPSKGSSVQVNIINNAPAEVTTTERTDGNGNQILDVTINAVKNAMARGKFDNEMKRFGVSARPGY